jgi:hypothetical protein
VLGVAARGEAVEQELDFGGHVVEPAREVGETLVGGARLPRADHPLAVGWCGRRSRPSASTRPHRDGSAQADATGDG